jgi:STE24 endopeptidase
LPFLVLLLLMLVSLGKWPAKLDILGPGGSALLMWLGIATLGAAAAWTGRRLSRRLRNGLEPREKLLPACGRHRRRLVLSLIAFFVAVLFLGWGRTVHDWLVFSGQTLPGVELAILTPFLAGLFLLWTFTYDMERTIRETSARAADAPFPGRGAYVLLQARHNLLLVLPPLCLLLAFQIVLTVLPASWQQSDWLLPALGGGLLLGVFVGVPWFLRLFLGLRPLPDGPLRDRLGAAARRLRFRCNDILLWDTRLTVANAMVTGPLPVLRYVVLTDRLLLDLTPEEVEAVFGHEVGHIKHHHMLFYFGFLMASMVALVGLWKTVVDVPGQDRLHEALSALPFWDQWQEVYETLTLLPLVTLVGGYIFVVFGFISRRCERQADIYGCRTVSPAVFIEALEKVARLNGMSRDRPGWLSSWLHSTIARRVDFLQQMSADPALGRRFQRRVGLLKWGMALSLALFLWGMWAVHGGQDQSFWTFLISL